MSLSTFLTSPWQNGVYGFTLPLIEKRHECRSKLGQSEPPGRLPPAPGPYVDQRTVLPQELLWVYFWRPFSRLSSLPRPSTSASRLVDTYVSQATLLTIANAVVTRRRAEVCTLPLSILACSEPPGRHPPAPGSHSSRPIPGWSSVDLPESPRNLFCTRFGEIF